MLFQSLYSVRWILLALMLHAFLDQHRCLMRAAGSLDVPRDKEFRTIFMPMDPDLALIEIPSVFYKVFNHELGDMFMFKDYHGNEFEISHRSGYCVAGFQQMVRYYRLWRGGYLKGFYVGKDIFYIRVANSLMKEVEYPYPPARLHFDKLGSLSTPPNVVMPTHFDPTVNNMPSVFPPSAQASLSKVDKSSGFGVPATFQVAGSSSDLSFLDDPFAAIAMSCGDYAMEGCLSAAVGLRNSTSREAIGQSSIGIASEVPPQVVAEPWAAPTPPQVLTDPCAAPAPHQVLAEPRAAPAPPQVVAEPQGAVPPQVVAEPQAGAGPRCFTHKKVISPWEKSIID